MKGIMYGVCQFERRELILSEGDFVPKTHFYLYYLFNLKYLII